VANLSSVVNTNAAPQIVSTGTLAAGQTDIGLNTAFPVNRYNDQQVGAVMVYVGGQLLMRNAGNAVASQTADGNYQEVDAGAGYSSLIRLNVADPNNSRPYVILSNGFNVAFNETSVQSQIQTLQTQQDNMATTLAEVAGIAVSSLYTPLNDATRAAFAAQFNTLQADAALKNVSNTWTQPQLMLGQTNGAAIPAGYVGEVKEVTYDFNTAPNGAWSTTSVLALTAGVWRIENSSRTTGVASLTVVALGISTDSGATSFSDLSFVTGNSTGAYASGAAFDPGLYACITVNLSASTNYYGKATPTGANARIRGTLRATRIA
jgi:hypothetical protein